MKIAKEFILRDIAGECVLVPTGATVQEYNGLIMLSDTARFIWENLEKVNGFNELVEAILEEYDIDKETAEKDAAEFLDLLGEKGLLEYTKEDKSW